MMAKVDLNAMGIKPSHTFDRLVVGPHNQIAAAAALEVAKAPGETYNPLFLFGTAGVGKTHLMHAIANQMLAQNPGLKARYISSERFTSEVISAVAEDSIMQLRQSYSQLDLLLLDDVQFLAESKATQGEFFHVFNNLHQQNRQVVMAADTAPNQMQGVDQTIRSRLEWGLAVDVKIPDVNARIEILKMKQQAQGLALNDDLLMFVARILRSNVRELEGFLKRLHAYVTLSHQQLSMELVKQVVRELVPPGADLDQLAAQEAAANAAPPPAAVPAPAAAPPAAPSPVPVAPKAPVPISVHLPPAPPVSPSVSSPAPLNPADFAAPIPPTPPAHKPPEPAVTNGVHKKPAPGVEPKKVEPAAPAVKVPVAPKAVTPPPPAMKPVPPSSIVPPSSVVPPPVKAPEPATPIAVEPEPEPIPDFDEALPPGHKEITAVFFYPAGKDKELDTVHRKFQEVIKKHKLKFRLKKVHGHGYEFKGKINYAAFVDVCKENHVPVAIVIGPPPDAMLPQQDFYDLLSVTLDVQGVSLQLINWTEIDKDYRYLNLALDIALVRSR